MPRTRREMYYLGYITSTPSPVSSPNPYLHLLQTPQPKQHPPQPHIRHQMLPQAPRHAIQILWRKHRPHKQVRPQHRTSRHHRRDTPRRKHRLHRHMPQKHPPPPTSPQQQHRRRRRPVDGPRPVPDKRQQPDDGGVVAGDAVVRAREVDRGDGVGAAEGEEGRVLQEEGGGAEVCEGEGGVVGGEEAGLEVEEEEEGDVGGAGLGYG